MKLDRGHATVPVPWPIQSSPTARANRPAISRNLRMSSSPWARFCRGSRHERWPQAANLGGRLTVASVGIQAAARKPRPCRQRKSPGSAGASEMSRFAGSVLGDERAAPVEAVDELAAHAVLAEFLGLAEGGREAGRGVDG